MNCSSSPPPHMSSSTLHLWFLRLYGCNFSESRHLLIFVLINEWIIWSLKHRKTVTNVRPRFSKFKVASSVQRLSIYCDVTVRNSCMFSHFTPTFLHSSNLILFFINSLNFHLHHCFIFVCVFRWGSAPNRLLTSCLTAADIWATPAAWNWPITTWDSTAGPLTSSQWETHVISSHLYIQVSLCESRWLPVSVLLSWRSSPTRKKKRMTRVEADGGGCGLAVCCSSPSRITDRRPEQQLWWRTASPAQVRTAPPSQVRAAPPAQVRTAPPARVCVYNWRCFLCVQVQMFCYRNVANYRSWSERELWSRPLLQCYSYY